MGTSEKIIILVSCVLLATITIRYIYRYCKKIADRYDAEYFRFIQKQGSLNDNMAGWLNNQK